MIVILGLSVGHYIETLLTSSLETNLSPFSSFEKTNGL